MSYIFGNRTALYNLGITNLTPNSVIMISIDAAIKNNFGLKVKFPLNS